MIYDAQPLTSNVINRWFIELTGKYDGLGMLLYVALTLFISAVISAIIGLERYRSGENAGIRTHALLSIASTFLMIISIWAIKYTGIEQNYDISRIAAGTITGIGFLGAGVIIKDRFTVKGLSTATTLLICAAIGLGIGAGFIVESMIAGCMSIFLVFLRNKVIVRIDKNAPSVMVKAKKGYPAMERIKTVCDKQYLNLKHMDITEFNDDYIVVVAYFPYKINPNLLEYFMVEMRKDEEVLDVKKVMKRNNKKFYDTHES